MKLGLRYRELPGSNLPDIQVFNAETGEPLEQVVSVAFTMTAQDMIPRMSIEFIPGTVHINDDGRAVATQESVRGIPTLPTREPRVVDLDRRAEQDE